MSEMTRPRYLEMPVDPNTMYTLLCYSCAKAIVFVDMMANDKGKVLSHKHMFIEHPELLSFNILEPVICRRCELEHDTPVSSTYLVSDTVLHMGEVPYLSMLTSDIRVVKATSNATHTTNRDEVLNSIPHTHVPRSIETKKKMTGDKMEVTDCFLVPYKELRFL